MDRNFPRLLDILAILQRTTRLTSLEVGERLASRGHRVSQRTVQRDLEELAQIYPLECDSRTRPYAWRWRSGAPRLSLPSMDWPEAISFYLLSTYLDGMMPASVRDGIAPYVEESRRRLRESFGQLPLSRWPERVLVVHGDPAFEAPRILRSVQLAVTEAVLLGRQLQIRYKAFGESTARPYVVSPLGLVQHGPTFYIPVRFDGHTDVRTLTMHRMQRASILPAASGIEGFNLSEWIASGAFGFGGSDSIRLVLQLREGAGGLLRETPLSEDQQLVAEREEVETLRATVQDTVQLRRWLLSLGSRVTVVEPAELRQYIRRELSRAQSGYSPAT